MQDNPYNSSPLYIESPVCDFVLSLIVEGTNILAHTRTPTGEELATFRHIVLSSQHGWNPHSIKFSEAIRSVEEEIEYRRSISSISSSVLYDDNEKEDDIRGYQKRLIASVKVTSAAKAKISAIALDDVPTPPSFVSKEQHSEVTETELSERWLIGLAQATSTLKPTTQNIFRSSVLPLGRCYKDDWLYHLTLLPGDWYTDT